MWDRGKPPATFHHKDYGLAFDICKNVKGREYSDNAFWDVVVKIGQQVGFSWGYAMWGYDKPHFQGDNHRKSNYRNAPQMPLYKEETDVSKITAESEKALSERDSVAAEQSEKVSAWAEKSWDKATKTGVFDGTRPGAPLTREQAAVVLDRL